ncbi:MAG: alanine--tRNA ligase [Lachnospiraceae bacterium]|nr:alanine--tRNA ligase [Lachnospiraceae bacterium]
MKKYGLNQIRKMYLEFFESKEHLKLKSFSLVPRNDKSLLLINSGMAPMKSYFTGQEIPPSKRVTTCQKCIRTGDIENVGKTARHLTFFEMLGNFSFGDYFKHEAIAWSWEFLTEVVGLEKDRLYPSIYSEDEEAFEIWTKEIGVSADRITRFYRDETGACDNFWEHGAGPCGPCSEIYYDRGIAYGCGKPDCKVGCDCDRFMEVWNNVFTQFESDGKGHYEELKQKNIDTGMGLERLAVVIQDVESVFDIDTMKAIRDRICEMAGVKYRENDKLDVSIRLITDHIRSVTFMTSDGIIPSNEGRGYVLRRLLRRAARHGRILGIQGLFLADLCKTVIKENKDGYPELEENQDYILKVLTTEEEKFNKTIDQGLGILEKMKKACEEKGIKILSGLDAFTLYDTYGFPIDLTKEILDEDGMSIDEDAFQNAMEEQKEKARKARGTTNYMGADSTIYEEIDPSIRSVFVGYEHLKWSSKITVLTTTDEIVGNILEGQKATIFVEETPFYATSGGQIADTGMIKTKDAEFLVQDTIKLLGGKIGHVGIVTKGMFQVSEEVELLVNESQRKDTAKNHSATHLLQKALRIVLGNHVQQHGSYVSKDRLRFDFSHFSPMTKEELEKVEEIVNEEIRKGLFVVTEVMDMEEAKKTGAMALFDEKYGDKVRVVKMGDFSMELCGGTHVPNTSAITTFKIISESGISANVRRIEALTGEGVFSYYKQLENQMNEISKVLKTEPSNLTKKAESLLEEIKNLNSENEKLKSKLAKNSLGDVMNQVVEIKGIKLLAAKATDVDSNGLRNLGDQLKEKLKEGVVVLVSSMGEKVNLIAMATEEAVKKGAHAGNLIKELAGLVGGGGGGRPNMAQAGGKNPSGMDEVLKKAPMLLEKQIKE